MIAASKRPTYNIPNHIHVIPIQALARQHRPWAQYRMRKDRTRGHPPTLQLMLLLAHRRRPTRQPHKAPLPVCDAGFARGPHPPCRSCARASERASEQQNMPRTQASNIQDPAKYISSKKSASHRRWAMAAIYVSLLLRTSQQKARAHGTGEGGAAQRGV